MKTISAELYLGLLFAQEAAGGDLIPGRFARGEVFGSDGDAVRSGSADCGCIHGAAYFYGGQERGFEASTGLMKVGIHAATFDRLAKRKGGQITVDETLVLCGVDVE